MSFFLKLEEDYSHLSKSQQKIARYLRENIRDLLFLPLSELAGRIGTSAATLVRFARALGYEGFPHMQRDVQAQMAGPQPEGQAESPAQLSSARAAAACENLAEMYRRVDPDQLGRVADILLGARQVLIVGYLDALSVAAELYHRLHCFREGMYFSRLILDWNDLLKLMSPDTAVLVVSFDPHYAFTHTCAKTARERGSRVVVLTDSPLSPFAGLADETLVFNLLRRPGKSRLNRLDLSPVSGFINLMTDFMEHTRADRLLDPDRHQEPYVD